MPHLKQYLIATLTTLLVLAAVGCSTDDDKKGQRDRTPPTILSTNPAAGGVGVALNTSVAVVFSEAMDASTVNDASFTLQVSGGAAVTGTVTYDPANFVATFEPDVALTSSTLYSATVLSSVQDLAGNTMVANHFWTFTTGTQADTTPPTVVSTTPPNSATGVSSYAPVTALFSEALNSSTVTTTSFTLSTNGNATLGSVSYSNLTATFTPQNGLLGGEIYTATLTTLIEDMAGNAMTTDYSWSFTTSVNGDTFPPEYVSTDPADLETDVPTNKLITALFNEALNPSTVNTSSFTLTAGGNAVTGTVSYSGMTATFTPASDLTASTVFTAELTTMIEDLAGNAMVTPHTWTFTTGAAPDLTAPTVTSTDPVDQAIEVPLNKQVIAVFDKQIDAATVTNASFTLMDGTNPVSGSVSATNGTTVRFIPSADLSGSTTYTATLTTQITDLVGNPLAANYIWSFTTGTAAALGPAPVVLGTAGNFVILAKSGVSVTGTTAITGNIGLSPAAGSLLTGFSETMDSSNVFSTSPMVTGSLYAADYAPPTPTNLTTAVLDMQAAYTDAAGRTLPDFTELGAGNIQGMTLVPGLYNWGTGVEIPLSVTLDGGANDVWIFQIGQDLDVGNGAIVTLLGGAQAKNIFWQVAGQTTLGTTSDFKGVVLCQTAIVMNTGAVVVGRALAQTAVTLDANTVTAP
jgi:hypothetical protein